MLFTSPQCDQKQKRFGPCNNHVQVDLLQDQLNLIYNKLIDLHYTVIALVAQAHC